MNRLCVACIVAVSLLVVLPGFSQTAIPSYSLSVTFQKTTNIIFPYRIEKADIGTGDVIGHKDALLPNVLFLKANRKGFVSTNLSVYTSDGKFYSFIVRYKEEPDTLNLSFAIDTKTDPVIFDTVNDAQLDSDAVIIQNAEPFKHRKTSSQQMKLILTGIYIKDHLMWFTLEMKNHSEVEYLPECVRFCVRDKHAGKRTAIQETDLPPVWRAANRPIVGQGTQVLVFAFSSITIDRHKKLVIQLSEKDGGRLLTLQIGNKTILKAHKWKNYTI